MSFSKRFKESGLVIKKPPKPKGDDCASVLPDSVVRVCQADDKTKFVDIQVTTYDGNDKEAVAYAFKRAALAKKLSIHKWIERVLEAQPEVLCGIPGLEVYLINRFWMYKNMFNNVKKVLGVNINELVE